MDGLKMPAIVRHVAARVSAPLAPTEVREQRKAACRACPSLLRTPFERCGRCGCPIVSKTSFQGATCPDNPPRW